MQKRMIPTNVDINGCAVCIKSNYFKMGCINFQPQVGGGKYAATGVMEIVYEEESFTDEPAARWELQN